LNAEKSAVHVGYVVPASGESSVEDIESVTVAVYCEQHSAAAAAAAAAGARTAAVSAVVDQPCEPV